MFKVGDRVRCIDSTGRNHLLIKGKEYTITEVELEDTGTYITVDEIEEQFDASRFELVEPQMKRGDKVLVWDNCEDGAVAIEMIFATYIKGARLPYHCVPLSDEDEFNNGEEFDTINYKHAKPILPTKQTVTLELTDEQLEKIREIIG